MHPDPPRPAVSLGGTATWLSMLKAPPFAYVKPLAPTCCRGTRLARDDAVGLGPFLSGRRGAPSLIRDWIVCWYPATAPNLAFLGLGRSRVFTGLSSVREDVPSPDRELLFAYNDSFRGGGDA